MKVLVTGSTGMIGLHFVQAFEKQGAKVIGLARSSSASRQYSQDDSKVIRCDILDYQSLRNVVKKHKPDVVIHMAAQAFNGVSWETEEITHQTNYFGTLNILRSVAEFVPNAKLLIACSSAEYGDFNSSDVPLKEERLMRPVTPYAVSKLACEALGYQYYSNYNLKVFLPRLFIHVGTGHPPATAIQNFARQLALIKLKKLPPIIKVGNTDSARDFIDVRDGVTAMMILLKSGKPGQAVNICTGSAHKIGDILEMLIDIADVEVKVIKDPALLRLSDEPLLLGDNTKIKQLGWKQQYSIRETLDSVFKDWMKRLS